MVVQCVRACLPELVHLAEVLRQELGRPTATTLLWVALTGVGEAERYLQQLADASRIDAGRLETTLACIRGALNDQSPREHHQHLVSQVLLRRFCQTDEHNVKRLDAYSRTDRRVSQKTPGQVAKLDDFVKIDSEDTEHLWRTTENLMHDALAAARTPSLFKMPKHVQTLKDAMALHLVRSLELYENHNEFWRPVFPAVEPAFNSGTAAQPLPCFARDITASIPQAIDTPWMNE